MRTTTNNPFEPGADRVPQVWAGRDDVLDDFAHRVRPRRIAGLAENGRTILGEPGIGKSVLVRRIAALAKADGDWVTPQIRIPRGKDPLPLVAAALLKLADDAGLATATDERVGRLLARLRGISIMGTTVDMAAADTPAAHVTLTEALVALGRAARPDGRAVLIHLDEVQNIGDEDLLSQLLVSLGDALAHSDDVPLPGSGSADLVLPIIVYLTGLPEFQDSASTRTGATFARRFGTTLLQPLTDSDIRASLHQFVTPGWGTVANGEPVVIHMTQGAVEAMAALPPDDRTLTRIAAALAYDKASQLGPTAQRLDTIRGVIERRGGRAPYRFRARSVEALLATDWP